MFLGRKSLLRPHRILALAGLILIVSQSSKADVPPPLAPPPVPTDFCGTIYNELNGDLQAFNTQLQTPPAWTPIANGPTINTATLAWANPNTGPQISNSTYLSTVLAQLQEVKALGVQGVSIPILFPILYEPFFGSQSAMQPYLDFYTQIAQAARAAGLKIIVDNEIMFSDDIQAGWSNTGPFYSSLTWPEYMAARATMAATIAQAIQPDFLILANEPDTENAQTGQTNLSIPADAALMVAGEIAAVQALNLPNPPKLGAGFGSWMASKGTSSLLNYVTAYVALPLDYIDFHLLPINTVNDNNFLDNALTIASMAAAVGKPVAIGQAWLSKVAASEWPTYFNIGLLDMQRSRQTFSFWAPLDVYYLQTAQALANYTQMLYLDLEQTYFLAAYQTYGGTAANGGSANCSCTTESCSDYTIMQAESPLATAADSESVYTTTAFSYYNQLVNTADTDPPTVPTGLTATPATTETQLSWTASSDNIGVAGYNIFRCTPPAAGQPCTGVLIASSTLPTYADATLTGNVLYNYQVQAFDFANNHSPLSATLSLLTYRTSADAATNLVATAVSAQEIDLSWSPPSNTNGLGQYVIYAGNSSSNLQQIAARPGTQTTYRSVNLAPGTTYYYGIVAKEDGISAPMTPESSATTLPLPNPPSSLGGTPTGTTIALTWQEIQPPNGLPISFYNVLQGTSPDSLTEVASTINQKYTATLLKPNTTYYFEIVAVDTGHDDSAPSDRISVTTAPMPAAPVNVAAVASSGTLITVTWSENIPPGGMSIQSYNIFRGTSPTSLSSVAIRTAPLYIDTTVAPNTTYYYAVQATDNGLDLSPMSAIAQVSTPPLPAAPANVAAVANSGTRVTLSWTETIPEGGLPIQYYNIFRGLTSGSQTLLGAHTGLQFIDIGVAANTTYYYSIQAVDTGADDSPMSVTVQVTTP